MINQTAKKILKALSFDGVEVEAFRHMADLKRLDPMKIFYKKIDSTQNEIWRLIESQTIKNKTLIMADIQTNGKGTHGRVWHTGNENNIAFSFYIETECEPQKLEGITIEIAQILIQIFEEKYGINLQIKAPNDIYYNGKKVGGILTESKIVGQKTKYIVVGIGINTNSKNFSDDIRNIATSIKKEFNIDVDNLFIVNEFCKIFEKRLMKRIEE